MEQSAESQKEGGRGRVAERQSTKDLACITHGHSQAVGWGGPGQGVEGRGGLDGVNG